MVDLRDEVAAVGTEYRRVRMAFRRRRGKNLGEDTAQMAARDMLRRLRPDIPECALAAAAAQAVALAIDHDTEEFWRFWYDPPG